jgi:hypothetical protein
MSETPAKDDAKKDDTKPATATKPSPARRAATKATTPTPPAATGPFWVQVGAFKDPDAAKRLASKLRDDNFKVEESIKRVGDAAGAPAAPVPKAPAASSGSDLYDVFVSGLSTEELTKRLAGKSMTVEPSGNSSMIKPSLPLRDAVALSKELAVDGFMVQVRRAGGGSTPAAASPPTAAAPAPSDGGTSLHRVRVGSFADRATALTAVRELEAKGYKPYIARGDQ